MAGNRITPEDKLLRIIENPTYFKQPFLSLRQNGAFFQKWKGQLLSLWQNRQDVNLFTSANFNKLLAGFAVLLTLSLGVYFYNLKSGLSQRLDRIERGAQSWHLQKEGSAPFMVNFEEGILKARKRNLFSFTPLKEKEIDPGLQEAIVTQDISKIAAEIKLVGIIWSQMNPEIMVEDPVSGRTILLKEGDFFGEVKIKKIYMDKVIVDVQGREWPIR